MKKIFSRTLHKTRALARAHKIVSVVAILILASAGYWSYSKLTSTDAETRYVLAPIERGTIVVSITGSGQVSASNQIELKPKASGDVVFIGTKSGAEIKAGTLIAQIDAR